MNAAAVAVAGRDERRRGWILSSPTTRNCESPIDGPNEQANEQTGGILSAPAARSSLSVRKSAASAPGIPRHRVARVKPTQTATIIELIEL